MINNPTIQRTSAEMGTFVLDSFAKLGISVPSGSRIAKMARVFKSRDGIERRFIKQGDADCLVAIEAQRDLQQLSFVFDRLPGELLADFRSELESIISDQLLPQQSLKNSPGRDNQFHLYVAAVAHTAGFQAVRNAEPDIVCQIGDEKLGLAAKRVKNIKQLRGRIAAASEQIERTRLPGLIVVETSLASNRENVHCARELENHEFMRLYHAEIRAVIDCKKEQLINCVNPWWVCGIIFHDQRIRLVNNRWEVVGITLGIPLKARCDSDPIRFGRQYERGLPNLVDSPLVVARPKLILPRYLLSGGNR